MMIAVVNEWVVTQVVDVDDSQYSQYSRDSQVAIDITNALPPPQVGWIFTGNALVPGPNSVVSAKITKLAFRERFTFAELLAIQAAQQTNMALQVLNDNVAVSTFIDLGRPDTISGVQVLVSTGLLTAQRASQILTTPPTAAELYQG